jgi:Tfp pilus assembly protein FimT
MKLQSGYTLVELLATLMLAVTIVAIGVAFTVPQIARQTMRSNLHTGGTFVRAARTEAVKRSRACRFVVDLDARTMSVVDTLGTASAGDDEVLLQAVFPSVVSVARPDPGLPITFAGSSPVYTVEFHPHGYVSSGTGEMVLFAGTQYGKFVVLAAGGVRYEHWNGATWVENL